MPRRALNGLLIVNNNADQLRWKRRPLDTIKSINQRLHSVVAISRQFFRLSRELGATGSLAKHAGIYVIYDSGWDNSSLE